MPGTPGLSTFPPAAGELPISRDLGKCRDLVSSPQHHVLPPEPETSDMDARSTDIARYVKARYTAGLLSAGLAMAPSGSAQEEERWVFGGAAGKTWRAHVDLNVMADDFTDPGMLRPRILKPDENLLPRLFEVATWHYYKNPFDPYFVDGMPRIWRGTAQRGWYTEKAFTYIDGDRNTFWWQLGFGSPGDKMNHEFWTFDLGTLVPLERFQVQTPPDSVTHRSGEPFSNFIPRSGELSGADDEERIRLELRGQQNDCHLENKYICSTSYRPLEFLLGEVAENVTAPIVVSFPTRYLRYLRWRTFPDGVATSAGVGSWPFVAKLAYAEFEVYGRGAAALSRYTTKSIDLGRPATLGKIELGVSRWRLDENLEPVPAPDADAGIGVRVKTGTTGDYRQYHTLNDQLELVVVDRGEYDRLQVQSSHGAVVFVGSQGPITDDFENWSPWSGPLAESGSRPGLASGRWFALQIEMRSGKPSEFARLDSLSIEIIPLLADRVVGEVAKAGDGLSPLASDVPLGEEVELSYAISAEFEEVAGGFDAVRIGTPSPPTFRSLRIGTPLDEVAPDSVAMDEQGLTVYLPRRITADEDLRIGLGTVLYTVAEELGGEVFNRTQPGRGQPVIGGDATVEIASNSLQVLASGNEVERTISAVDIRPRAVTPNGDGFNDSMEIRFALFGVLETDVEVVFYDLGGNPVSRIMGTSAGPGTHALEWDGRDEEGRALTPGVYLCEVAAETGRGRFQSITPVAVAY